jgi:transposase
MLSLSNHTRIFVYSDPADMRKGFNGLSGLVAEHFDVQLLSGHLFLFCNRSRDRIKLLYWDKDGLAIWYKRLESGSYQLPKANSVNGSLEIDQTQLSLLLSGIDLTSVKLRKRYRVA